MHNLQLEIVKHFGVWFGRKLSFHKRIIVKCILINGWHCIFASIIFSSLTIAFKIASCSVFTCVSSLVSLFYKFVCCRYLLKNIIYVVYLNICVLEILPISYPFSRTNYINNFFSISLCMISFCSLLEIYTQRSHKYLQNREIGSSCSVTSSLQSRYPGVICRRQVKNPYQLKQTWEWVENAWVIVYVFTWNSRYF